MERVPVTSMPLSRALARAAAELGAAGVPSPRVDAELLAAHVLGVTRGRLATLVLLERELRVRRR